MQPDYSMVPSIAIVHPDREVVNRVQQNLTALKFQLFGAFNHENEFIHHLHQQKEIPRLALLATPVSASPWVSDLGTRLRKSYGVLIVYLLPEVSKTNHFRVLASQPDAVLRQPVDLQEFHLVLELVLRKPPPPSNLPKPPSVRPYPGQFIFLRSGKHYHKIILDQVLWVEGRGSYSEMIMISGRHLIPQNLKELEASLQYAPLMRIHRSYLVNILHVDLIEQEQLLVGGQKLPLSRNGKQRLKQRLNIS